jgi:hypothetical protein
LASTCIPTYKIAYSKRKARHATFRIAHIEARIADLPQEFWGYRIVQLTDLHYGPLTTKEHIIDAINISNSLEPDLVALTGDNVQLSPQGFRHFFLRYVLKAGKPWRRYRKEVRAWAKDLNELFASLWTKDGVVGVLGNHEYHEGWKTIVHALKNCKTWLINSSLFIERNGQVLKIIGLDDSRYGRPDIRKAKASYKNLEPDTLSPAQQNPFFKIMLLHNPDVLTKQQDLVTKDPHLILAGHTHGGQIRFPLIGPIITRTKQRKFVRGLIKLDQSSVFVNSGVGWGGLKLRLNCPPEVAVIELQPSA